MHYTITTNNNYIFSSDIQLDTKDRTVPEKNVCAFKANTPTCARCDAARASRVSSMVITGLAPW